MTTDQLAETTVLPSLGKSVEQATVTRWLKTAGDYVEAEEPLLEVATDKVDTRGRLVSHNSRPGSGR